MNIFQRLFGKQRAPDAIAGRLYVSEEGKKRGANPLPMIVFGHFADQISRRVAQDTTMNCIAVTTLEELEGTLQTTPALAIRAQSRPEFPGEAGQAIRLFKRYINGITFYGAWDYNVDRAAARALEYEADGIEMPGIRTDELYAYLFGVIDETCRRVPRPTTAKEHRDRLKKYTTDASLFWAQEDLLVSEFY